VTFSFRPAKRENMPLIIGLAGASGSGKTYSAMRLAKGIAGGKPFAVVDTERRRACHYADFFTFDHGDLGAPFEPRCYAEAICAADKLGKYAVIVVDSMSHEWAGDGGILDMQTAEFERMGGGDNVKMASWIKPKMDHKRMVQRLLQLNAHLILCFRAEQKIEMVKEGGKMVVRDKRTLTGKDGWAPTTEKSLPFELTASFLMTPDAPGVGRPIKLQEQHKALFPAGKVIDEACGAGLAAWAAGGESQKMREELPTTVEQTFVGSAIFLGIAIDYQEQEAAGKTVYCLKTEDTSDGPDHVFKTLDAEIGAQAEALLGQPVEIEYTKTPKGGLQLDRIVAGRGPA